MRHGKVKIETANLPKWVKVEPVIIGTDSPNSTVLLDAVKKFTVDVPLADDEDFQTRLDAGMEFKFTVYFNVMNISQLTIAWSTTDIEKTSGYKKIKSGGANYVTAEQVQNITKQVANTSKVYSYQDPEMDEKIVAKAFAMFDTMRGETQELSVKNSQQATELESKLLEGTGLSPSEFKPLTLMWDVYEKLETVDDHKQANEIIQDTYQRSKQAYQKLDDVHQRNRNADQSSNKQSNLDKSSSNQFDMKAGASYSASPTFLEGKGDLYYNHDSKNSESVKRNQASSNRSQLNDKTSKNVDASSAAEDKINKGYFQNSDELKAYQAQTTEAKRPEVKIVGRGLNVIEKSTFMQNFDKMASFVFVQPMREAKSFMSDSMIATNSVNDVPSLLEKLKKAVLLTDAVSVYGKNKVTVSVDGNEVLEGSRTKSTHPDFKEKGTYERSLKILAINDDSQEIGKTSIYGNLEIEGDSGHASYGMGPILSFHQPNFTDFRKFYMAFGDTHNNSSIAKDDFIFFSWEEGGKNHVRHMTLKAGGNVGIGTTTPKAKLEVNGDIKAKSFEGQVKKFGKMGTVIEPDGADKTFHKESNCKIGIITSAIELNQAAICTCVDAEKGKGWYCFN